MMRSVRWMSGAMSTQVGTYFLRILIGARFGWLCKSVATGQPLDQMK